MCSGRQPLAPTSVLPIVLQLYPWWIFRPWGHLTSPGTQTRPGSRPAVSFSLFAQKVPSVPAGALPRLEHVSSVWVSCWCLCEGGPRSTFSRACLSRGHGPPVSGSCRDIAWLRSWPCRKSPRCWLGRFPSPRSVAAVTMTAPLTGCSWGPAPRCFTAPALADLTGGGAGTGVTGSREREGAGRFLNVVVLPAERPRRFPGRGFSQVPRETTNGTGTLKVIYCEGGLCTHGGWEVPRSAVFKLETQESWWCNSVCV